MEIEEIKKKAYEKYPAKLAVVDLKGQEPRQIDLNEEARNAYIEAYKEISALPTIKGWVARDKDGTLCFYSGAKPWRYERMFYDDPHQHGDGDVMRINGALFPDLRWEDEPKEVEIIIKTK